MMLLSWTEILSYSGGGTDPQRQAAPGMPQLVIGGIAYDRAQPDHVYAAVNKSLGPFWSRTWLEEPVAGQPGCRIILGGPEPQRHR